MNFKHEILTEAKYLGLSVDEVLEIMDTRIGEWHGLLAHSQPLPDYLGLTWVEYAYFVEHPESFALALLRTPHTSQKSPG